MDSFTELLSDAFSETTGPSFPGEDLDFENLNFDENCEEDEAQSATTKRDGALLQEAAAEAAALFGEEAEEVYRERGDEESDEEDFQGGLTCLDKAPKEDYSSSGEESDEEGSASGDEEEDGGEPGELLVSVRCADEVFICEKEDGISAGGRPLAPRSAEKPQVSNSEQRDEELSYFGQVPERGSETGRGSDVSDEDERESDEDEFPSQPEGGGMKIELDHPGSSHPAGAGSAFQCLSLQNLQDLITDVDDGECVEKMKEFSGEEHQDAGESFADYPSDFSSCEYVEDGARGPESDATSGCSSHPQQNRDPEPPVTDVTWSNGAENPEDMDVAGAERIQGEPVVLQLAEDDGDQTGENDSYSSSDDDYDDDRGANVTRSGGGTSSYWGQQDLEEEDARLLTPNSRVNPADFGSWDFGVLNTERLLSGFALTTQEIERDSGDHNSYSVVTRQDTTTPSSQGSLDDGFFFDAGVETSGVTEAGSNEYEERRSWEQEQERIKAFYEYYDDSDEENEREGRQTKVQFFADPLSQVIHYESESDRDSLSSSTDREDDQSSADTSDEVVVPDDTQHLKPESDPLASLRPDDVPNIRNAQIGTRRHRCLGLLKLMLKTSLATAAGLLLFWLATDQADWLHQVSIF